MENQNQSICIDLRFTATYDPDDNKLRIREINETRLPKDLYSRLKDAGFKWAPQQRLFVAPMWTPYREKLALGLAYSIDDERDYSTLSGRAEERSKRFEAYQNSRSIDAEYAATHADNLAGDALITGTVTGNKLRKAHKKKDKTEKAMQRAVNLFETSEYWERRSRDVIKHASFKDDSALRFRRIGKLEAEQRKYKKEIEKSELFLKLWNSSKYDKSKALNIANVDPIASGLWSDLDSGKIKEDEAKEVAIYKHDEHINHYSKWLNHTLRRIKYEKALLIDQGCNYDQSKKAQKESAKKNRPKQPPIVNYPGEGFLHITKEDWKVKQSWGKMIRPYNIYNDLTVYKKGIDGVGHYRLREYSYGMVGKVIPVYITDQKIIKIPAIPTEKELQQEENKTNNTKYEITPKPQPAKTEPNKFDKMREVLNNGGLQVSVSDTLYPTPLHIAKKMTDYAGIQPGERILEPSGGTGILVDAALNITNDLYFTIIEKSPALHNSLIEKYPGQVDLNGDQVQIKCADFLSVNPADTKLETHDTILMNPPFNNGQDIKHIKHALNFLADSGGTLVAICANGSKQAKELQPLADHWEVLPVNTFKQSGTSVNTVLLVIRQ